MNNALFGLGNPLNRLLQITKPPFLLITDGSLVEVFSKAFPRATIFDPHKHSFDPLKGLNYLKAVNFVELLKTAFPAAQGTLTKEDAYDIILEALLAHPKSLATLIPPSKDDPGRRKAHAMIRRLFLSPTLTSVFSKKQNFHFHKTSSIIARINRAELGDFDALIIVSALLQQFKGQLIVLDVFYVRDFYTTFINEDRLTVAVPSLSRLPLPLKEAILGIQNKTIYRTTPADARELIVYTKHTEPRNIYEQTEGEYLTSGLPEKAPAGS